MRLFVFLLLSHFLGDYVLYINKLSVMKRAPDPGEMFVGNGIHAFIHFICTMVVLVLVGFSPWIWTAVLVFLAHFTIDFTRCLLEMGVLNFGTKHVGPKRVVWACLTGDFSGLRKHGKFVVSALIDQLIHVGSLYWISQL